METASETRKEQDVHLTKYLQETRKVWSGNHPKKQKGLPKHICVFNIKDEHDQIISREIHNIKTGELIDQISTDPVISLHQLDVIRLQNEINQLKNLPI